MKAAEIERTGIELIGMRKGRGTVVRLLAGAIACTALTLSTAIATAADLNQDLARIFSTTDLAARSFGPAEWIDNGTAYLTLEDSPSSSAAKEISNGAKDIVRYDTETGRREILVSATDLVPPDAPQPTPLHIERYAFSRDKTRVLIYTNSQRVWRQNTRGDYWLFDRQARTLKKLGGDTPPASLMFAKLSPDARLVAFVRANNLYVEDLASGAIRPLTTDGSATIINGTSDWVYEEEFDLRDAFRWSADSTRIAYWRFDSSGVGSFSLLKNSAGPYPAIVTIPYPKAGTTNSAVKIGVVSVNGGGTRWIDLPGDPREQYVARMDWLPGSSTALVLQRLNRLQNRNDVLLADAGTGRVRELFHDQDEAWVDVMEEFRWLAAGKEREGARLLWLSERDGWRRPYLTAGIDTAAGADTPAALTPLTTAPADTVQLLQVDPAGDWVYYIASPTDATQRQLFRVRTTGNAPPEQLTPATARGVHDYQISPDCRWAFHTYSTIDQPPVTELIRLPSHQVVRVLEDNHRLRANAADLLTAKAQFFKVDIGDGATLDGWMLTPPDFDPARRYPVVTYVYGEPASATVLDAWGAPRMLFHRALARAGYVVLSFDNRGTPAPKGRAWRKVIYGEVGVLSAKDQAAAIRAFAGTHPFIDTSRMAIWGWSGGGSNTLNVMFRAPGLYAVGVAVAPVADQSLYDTVYQERYMGLPQQNVDGYRRGSPINFAEGLEGHLLIIHGSGDDNVHIQGTERLVSRLIELGKPFDYFVYPERTHAIREGKGTSLDVHKRIAAYINQHLATSSSSAMRHGTQRKE